MATAKQVDFLLVGLRHPDTDEPLAGGKVLSYEAGTSTPKALYIARDTTEGEAANPVILSATGNAEVYGNGVYKFTITDADDVTVYEIDDLEYSAAITSSGVGPLTADLDFDGFIGVNLAAGSEAGDTVEWQQWTDSISVLTAAVAAKTFLSLTDTPSSYSGQAGKVPKVNAGTTALEFVTPASLITAAAFTDLSDTPASLSGAGNKFVKVNAGATALEFVAQTSADVPVGSVVLYAGAAALPAGWGACDGSEYTIADYPALAAALGSVWGTGVGSIKVPDLRGMFVKGVGANSSATIKTAAGGAYTGAALGQLVTDKLQGHDHTCKVDDATTPVGYGPYGGNHHAYITNNTSGIINDKAGTYGTVRAAAYTEPGHACIQYIIKVS